MNAGVLIFAVLFGIAGYGEANRTMKRYGRTPFGWPALVWGLLCFLSWVVGVILLAIAERVIRNRAAKTPMYGGSYIQPVYAAPAGYGPPTAYRPPAQHPLGYGPPVPQPAAYGAPAQPAQPRNSDILPK